MSKDRRSISRLLLLHFPNMEKATSEEWAAFLDNITGLTTPADMPNGSAFDAWRKALAEQGYPVWGVTPEREVAIKARVEVLKDLEAKRLAAEPELMAKLKKEAPLVTAADLIKATKETKKQK